MIRRSAAKILVIGLLSTAVLIAKLFDGAPLTHAAAETVYALPKISEIYPNGPGSSERGTEFIELVNIGNGELDLNQYALQIKSTSDRMHLTGVLAAGSHKAFITTFALANGGSTIQLVNSDTQEVIEEVQYSGGASETQSWSYFSSGWELAPITKDAPNQRYTEPGDGDTDSPVSPTMHCSVQISEISPQPNFSGQEYIEFYNNSVQEALLEACKLKINGGLEKALPDVVILPGQYYVVTYTSGTIKNSAGSITLVNSDNLEIPYPYPATSDGQSVNYAVGLNSGEVTNNPTPGGVNVLVTNSDVGGSGGGTLADCGPGKFRNPETNRCKNIETDSAALASCAPDQERNPATNRCRKIATASADLKPCQAGQERNPETNRCKKIESGSSSLKPCEPGQERNPETNRCRKIASAVSGTPLEATSQPAAIGAFKYKTPLIGLLVLGLVGYGVYEYRSDISNYIQRMRQNKRRGRPPG